MTWLINRIAENLDVILALADITSGARKLLFSALLCTSLIVCSGCTYTRRSSQDAIGTTTDIYALSWGEPASPAVVPQRYSPPPAPTPQPEPTPYLGSHLEERDLSVFTSPKDPLAFLQ